MELNFDQSLFIRTSAVKIQQCSRQELEDMFMALLKLKICQENTFNKIIRGDVNNQIESVLDKTKDSNWSESFLQY